jgi:hypothetical protein
MRRISLLAAVVLLVGCARNYGPGPTSIRGPEPPIPPPAAAPKTSAAAAWKRFETAGAAEYLVRPRETLSEIAQGRLGSVRAMPLLLLANPDLASPHAIVAEEPLLVPTPAFFAGPFLAAGEKAASVDLLRWSEGERTAFIGVHVEDSGPAALDRFIVLEAHGGGARLVFSSADCVWQSTHFSRYRRGWTWRAVDLDGDSGLDLVASRHFGTGAAATFYAYAFHSRAGNWSRHALAAPEPAGDFPVRRPLCSDGVITMTSGGPSGARIYLRWTGNGFESRRAGGLRDAG